MTRTGAVQHILAALAAALLVFVLKVQDFDLRRIAPVRDDWLRVYTPYFPGLNDLDRHEVFSPRYAHVHKIVFLGASAVDSVGCDGTWTYPDTTRMAQRNADASCSIAAQMNRQFPAEGVNDWRAFDVARVGSKLTSMLYVYAQLRRLKPDLVIFGETFPYYLEENADAQFLSGGQYAELDRMFGSDPSTHAVWQAYRQTLIDHGWRPSAAPERPSGSDHAVTLHSLIYDCIVNLRRLSQETGPPAPIRIARFRQWPPPPPSAGPFRNPDPGLAYFQGLALIARGQQEDGGKFFFYFSPQYDRRNDLAYQQGLEQTFGGYMKGRGIPYASLIAMPLKPDYETYDGVHQTIYGNRRIAAQLLASLRQQGLIGAH